MRAVRMHVIVPEHRQLTLTLPNRVPPGEVEIIVLVDQPTHSTAGARPLFKVADAWRATHPERRTREDIDRELAAERDSWDEVR